MARLHTKTSASSLKRLISVATFKAYSIPAGSLSLRMTKRLKYLNGVKSLFPTFPAPKIVETAGQLS